MMRSRLGKIYVFLVIVSACLLHTHHVLAQGKTIVRDSVEVTDTDFTKMPAFNGNHAKVFGISLGMGVNRAKQILANMYPGLQLAPDAFNQKRYYLSEKGDTSRIILGYFKWPNYDTGLYQIVLYPAMANHFKGIAAVIFSPESENPQTELYKTFLGEPSARQVTMDMPKIKAKTTMLYYPKYNIALEVNTSADNTTYNLVFTRKW